MIEDSVVRIKNERLKSLEEIFNNWAKINSRYIKSAGGDDCAYYFSERMNCSMINAACYKTKNFVSLVEVPVERKKIRGKNNSGAGRYDLYIFDGEKDYLVEAKQAWDFDKIEKMFDQSKKQIKSIKKDYRSDICIAMVFVVIGFTDVDEDVLVSHISEIDKIESCGTVHYYPKETRNLHGGGRYESNIYPGISIVMRHID